MANNDFEWAKERSANVRKPLEETIKKGWKQGDIPKASHFNWALKGIADDLTSLRVQQELYFDGLKYRIDQNERRLKSLISENEKHLDEQEKRIDDNFNQSLETIATTNAIKRSLKQNLESQIATTNAIEQHLKKISEWQIAHTNYHNDFNSKHLYPALNAIIKAVNDGKKIAPISPLNFGED